MNQKQAATEPTLYFDGACPVCSREVNLYRSQEGANAVRWIDVSACSAEAVAPDLTRQQAMARLHFRRSDGRLVSGAEAFASLWQTLPRWAWLGRIAGTRPALWLLEPAYRIFLFIRRTWRRPG